MKRYFQAYPRRDVIKIHVNLLHEGSNIEQSIQLRSVARSDSVPLPRACLVRDVAGGGLRKRRAPPTPLSATDRSTEIVELSLHIVVWDIGSGASRCTVHIVRRGALVARVGSRTQVDRACVIVAHARWKREEGGARRRDGGSRRASARPARAGRYMPRPAPPRDHHRYPSTSRSCYPCHIHTQLRAYVSNELVNLACSKSLMPLAIAPGYPTKI